MIPFNNLNMQIEKSLIGQWNRESNRGHELEGKRLELLVMVIWEKHLQRNRGFDVEVLCLIF
jgi:D-3-phosphoglycerate dehydrogenase